MLFYNVTKKNIVESETNCSQEKHSNLDTSDPPGHI